MTRTGNTGQVVTGVNGVFHNNFFKVNYDERLDKDFLVQFLRSEKTQKLIIRYAGTSTIPDLNHKDFYRLSIPLYDIQQQIKIGNLLSTMDKLIEDKESLINYLTIEINAKLNNIYDNLVGDSIKLGDLVDVYSGLKGKTKADFDRHDVNAKYIQFKNIHTGVIKFSELGNVHLDNDERQERVLLNDILITGSSENIEEVGTTTINELDERNLYLNSFSYILRPKNIHPKYLHYYLKSKTIRKKIINEGQGITRINLSPTRIIGIKITTIDTEKQKKIANLLSSMDKTIDLHKQELEQLKLKKKYYLNKIFN